MNDNVSPELLTIVTSREVEAGRMSSDDELRKLAIGGVAAMPAALLRHAPPDGVAQTASPIALEVLHQNADLFAVEGHIRVGFRCFLLGD